MSFDIAKPDTHNREYAFLELENGLKVIIGSEPECDKAGAALCVNVGMCHERKDLPGLAHFLEHMLFTGTKKYPKEGEYHEFIQQNGGSANAYTTCYFTNYMFEIKPEMLSGAIDRFSRFFSEPLLTRDCTDREINAVDSEFQGGFTEPWWRYVGIMHQSANPDHPFHVAVGNNKVLKDDPKERGIDLYDEMKKLFDDCYSANGMTLCIFGKESVAEMSAMVKELFSGIPNKNVTMPIGAAVSDKPAFLPQDWNRLLLQNPVKDVKDLTFSWVLPYQAPSWKAKPTQYVSHLLGYEGEGSVIAVLKQKGLISACSAGDGGWLEGAFSLINVSFDLTDKGLEHIEEIGEHLFAFIGMLQKTPVQQWIFEEMRKLRNIQFKFMEDLNPFDLCSEIALSLQTHPPQEALAGSVLLYEYNPESIAALIGQLTLDSVRVSHQAKCLADRCTDKDTSYSSPMKFLPLEDGWLATWRKALAAGDGSPQASVDAAAARGLHLPKPNPFIPEDLSLKPIPKDNPPLPVALEGCVAPVALVVHRQDDLFKQPKAHVQFLIYSPYITKDAASFTKVEMWCRSVEEALSEFAYDAQVAGVSYALGIGSGAVSLSVAGFNDKLSVLLQAVTEKMRSMLEVPDNIFSIVSDGFQDELRNAVFHSQPYAQCSSAFSELTSRGSSFPAHQRYEACKSIKREDLNGLASEIFAAAHVEAIAIGNLTPDDAKALSSQLVKGLGLSKPLEALPQRAEAVLPDGPTLWVLKGADPEDPNHAVFVRIQLLETLESEVMLRLVDKVLGPKFFDVLRTQQQLGYIVQLGSNVSTKFGYLYAVVQTEFQPDYARSRIDAFFDENFKFMEESLAEEEFEVCRAGILSELKQKPKNLGEELGRYKTRFGTRTYDFGRRQRAIDYLEKSATLAGLKAFVRDTVRGAPRMYSQVVKTHPKEDKALPDDATPAPADPAGLRRWDGLDCVKSFTPGATWLELNAEVDAPAVFASASKL